MRSWGDLRKPSKSSCDCPRSIPPAMRNPGTLSVATPRSWTGMARQAARSLVEFFDITVFLSATALLVVAHLLFFSYPLLGPRFIGTRLNWHTTPRRLQLEHVSRPVSELASHRTCRRKRVLVWMFTIAFEWGRYRTFFRRHSSQALEIFDRLRALCSP